MAEQQQDRFWEVMDPHGVKHVVCASHYNITGGGDLVFRTFTGEPDGDAPCNGRTVARFQGYIYVKDIADEAQAGETARESDNLEAQVAAATAELAQDAHQAPETGSIEARLARIEAALVQAGYLMVGAPKAANPSFCECRSALTVCDWCQALAHLDRAKSDARIQEAVDAQAAEAERRVGAHQVTGRRTYAETADPRMKRPFNWAFWRGRA